MPKEINHPPLWAELSQSGWEKLKKSICPKRAIISFKIAIIFGTNNIIITHILAVAVIFYGTILILYVTIYCGLHLSIQEQPWWQPVVFLKSIFPSQRSALLMRPEPISESLSTSHFLRGKLSQPGDNCGQNKWIQCATSGLWASSRQPTSGAGSVDSLLYSQLVDLALDALFYSIQIEATLTEAVCDRPAYSGDCVSQWGNSVTTFISPFGPD